MAKNIVIYLTDSEAEQAQWLICDDQGNAVSETRRDTLENIASQVEGRKVTVVVPAEWVSLLSVTQAGGTARALKAIPYALEEMVSEDVEDLHFAIGEKQPGDNYPVAVISIQQMQLLQQRFNKTGLRPTELRPEPQALPRFKDTSNGWTALSSDDRFVVRLDDFGGYAIDTDNAGFMLEHSLQEAGDSKPAGIVLFADGESPLQIDDAEFDIEVRPYTDTLGLLARGVHNSDCINLLQGDFSFKMQFDRAWKPWRPAMALLVLLAVVLGAGKFIEHQKLSKQVSLQKAQMEEILRRTFPSIKRVVNPRKQMQTELKRLGASGGGDGFVSVISSISSAIGTTGNTNLNSISYKSGRIDLDLDTDQLGTLDKLKQTLETDGKYSMSIESANQSNGRIRGRIRVEVKG